VLSVEPVAPPETQENPMAAFVAGWKNALFPGTLTSLRLYGTHRDNAMLVLLSAREAFDVAIPITAADAIPPILAHASCRHCLAPCPHPREAKKAETEQREGGGFGDGGRVWNGY
jgi:hypothetical protein